MLSELERTSIRLAVECFDHLSELERQAMAKGLESLFHEQRQQKTVLTAER